MQYVAARDTLAIPPEIWVEGTVGVGAIPPGFGLEVELRIALPGLSRPRGGGAGPDRPTWSVPTRMPRGATFVPGAWERQTLWLAPEASPTGACTMLSSVSTCTSNCSCTRTLDGDDAHSKALVVFSPMCRRIVPKISLTTFYSILEFHPMWKMDSCWEGSTRATRGLRYTTRACDHSQRPCRFC